VLVVTTGASSAKAAPADWWEKSPAAAAATTTTLTQLLCVELGNIQLAIVISPTSASGGHWTHRIDSSHVQVVWKDEKHGSDHAQVIADGPGVVTGFTYYNGNSTSYWLSTVQAVGTYRWSVRAFAPAVDVFGDPNTVWLSSTGANAPAGYPQPPTYHDHCATTKILVP